MSRSRAPITKQTRGGLDVVNIFSTRPLNAIDSIKSGGALTVDATELIETGAFSLTIPNGYTGVIQGVNFFFDPIYPPNTLTSVSTKIFIDNEALKHNDAIADLQSMNFIHHFIASEKNVVEIKSIRISTITLTARNAASAFPYEPTFTCALRITMIPTSNIAANLERLI